MDANSFQWRLPPGRVHREEEARARKLKICDLLDQGLNPSQIAREFGLSSERIRQLVAEIKRNGFREKYGIQIFPLRPNKQQIDNENFLEKVDKARIMLTNSFLAYSKNDFLAAGIQLLEARDIIEKLRKKVKG